MSKNFADEYKALANEELPDLWNRIESGLAPKATDLAGEEKPEKGKVISFLYRYRTVVAAAVCVIMILPAAILLGRGNRSKSFSGSAADTAAEMPEEAPADDMADTTSEEMYRIESEEAVEEAAEEPEAEAGKIADSTTSGMGGDYGVDGKEAYSETDRIEELNSEDAAPKEMNQQENRNVQSTRKEEAADIAEEEKAFSEKQNADQSLNSTADRETKILEKVTVEAVKQTGETVETDEDFFYGIRMKVIEDASGELEKGTEITVWVSYLSSVAYVQGQEYVLDLSYDSDSECPYRVKKNYFS